MRQALEATKKAFYSSPSVRYLTYRRLQLYQGSIRFGQNFGLDQLFEALESIDVTTTAETEVGDGFFREITRSASRNG